MSLKRVLIISPYFPPSNTPDMQRVRMSLPYFQEFGWEVEVVRVNDSFSEMTKDEFLMQSIPNHIKIHSVKALPKRITSKLGLGSISLRSLWFYRKKVNTLLRNKKYDLIFFSTTEFPITILGPYWKKKFKIPYIIDLQDPWHTDYYKTKPAKERPKKYWFSYRLNKILEPIAIKNVDGLISVSSNYILILKERYSEIASIPSKVITFGFSKIDFKIAEQHIKKTPITLSSKKINIIYTGAVGYIMKEAITTLFRTLNQLRNDNPTLLKDVKFYFIGTSYATHESISSVRHIAIENNVENMVVEYTHRIGFYESIFLLKKANGLIILGSDDVNYTPSKIYPYIFAGKPILGLLNKSINAAQILSKSNTSDFITYKDSDYICAKKITQFIYNCASILTSKVDFKNFEKFTARNTTLAQVELFNSVIENNSF